jgi:hypothetical protein
MAADELCKRLLDALIANWPLILVGTFGVLIALRALKPAESASKAAFLNAQAVINAERPWLLVSIEAISDEPDMYIVQAFNAGRTPAELHEGHCACEKHSVGFEPSEDFQDPFWLPMQNLIVSGDSFEVRKIAPEAQVGPAERDGQGMDPQMLYVCLVWRICG